MKQLFPCGHRGKGKHCHRCAQAEKLRYKAVSGVDPGVSRACFDEADRLKRSSLTKALQAAFHPDPVTRRMRENYD
jgi:hypothetical protein